MSSKSKAKVKKAPAVVKRGPGRPSRVKHAVEAAIRESIAPATPTTEQIVEAAVRRMAEEMAKPNAAGAEAAEKIIAHFTAGAPGQPGGWSCHRWTENDVIAASIGKAQAQSATGPITSEVAQIQEAIAGLSGSLLDLESRLAPICGPAPEPSPAKDEPASPSQLAQDLAGIRRKIGFLTARVDTLRNSIAL
jgi:hypothetical protein